MTFFKDLDPKVLDAIDGLVTAISGEKLVRSSSQVLEVLDSAAEARREASVGGQVRREAALRGYFQPSSLVTSLTAEDRTKALSELLPDCTVETLSGRRMWLMQRSVRREILAELLKDPQALRDRLAKLRLPREDRLGHNLRALLRGDTPRLDRVYAERLTAMLSVADWLDGIFEGAPAVEEVRAELADRSFESDFQALLRHGLVGRTNQLRTLKRFVDRKAGENLPVMAVTGVGGVGKSTLLAKLALDREKKAAPGATVYLDFDRPNLSTGDTMNLLLEFARQLGRASPELAEELEDFRRQARRTYLSGGTASSALQEQVQSFDLESVSRASSELTYNLGRLLERHGLQDRPIVLLLDTVEQLVALGASAVDGIQQLLSSLYWDAGLRQLKVIASGRVIEEDAGSWHLIDNLELGELDGRAAVTLLVRLGVTDRSAASHLVDNFGGNPLILRLLAQLLRHGKLSAEDLIDDEGQGKEIADRQLTQGFLYRRILRHVGRGVVEGLPSAADPNAVREVARLGLVLRRVTPDLVEKVLAPHGGLEEIDHRRAREIFEALQREAWLVQRTGPDEVQHRSDLRTIMLRLIQRDDGEREAAAVIHQAAVGYYEADSDPNLSHEAQAAQALYHRLMIGDSAALRSLDRERVNAIRHLVVNDLDGFPKAASATLRHLLGRPLTEEESKSLPEHLRVDFIVERGWDLVGNDRPDEALALIEGMARAFAGEMGGVWELRAVHRAARWEQYREAIVSAARTPGTRRPTHPPDPREGWMPWTIELALLALRLGEYQLAVDQAMEVAVKYDESVRYGKTDPDTRIAVLRSVNYARIAAASIGEALDFDVAGLFAPVDHRELVRSPDLALQHTRNLELDCRFQTEGKRDLSLGQIAFVPSLDWLVAVEGLFSGGPGAAWKLRNPELESKWYEFRAWLEKTHLSSEKKPSSGVLLGKISQQFTEAVRALQLEFEPARSGDLAWLIRSYNPEIRSPARYALWRAFQSENQRRELAERAWKLFTIHPSDLEPADLARDSKRFRSKIASLVEYADRCHVLDRFLAEARDLAPEDEVLAAVADALDRWNQAFRQGGLGARGASL